MTDKRKSIVVVGQGAMGLLWYHHLSQANINTDVSLLASNLEQLSASERASAQYEFSPYQQEHTDTYPLTYSQISDIKRANIIMFCLKSFHIASALHSIAKDINPQCQVILAHNGMGTFEDVAKLLPSEQVILAMLTTHGCLRSSALKIVHTGLGQSDIGLLAGELSLSQQNQLTNLLSPALPEVTFHANILAKQWLKLAINCVINPITAIYDINNGEVNNNKFTAKINRVLTEITEVSQKAGTNLALADLQEIVVKVAQATAKNCSSMRCDVLAGKPTEIDYINGYIHRLGKQFNVATPENTRLWQQVLNLKA